MQDVMTDLTTDHLGARAAVDLIVSACQHDFLIFICKGRVAEVKFVRVIITDDPTAIHIDHIDAIAAIEARQAKITATCIFDLIPLSLNIANRIILEVITTGHEVGVIALTPFEVIHA